MDIKDLKSAVYDLGLVLDDTQLERLDRYKLLLQKKNEVMNLTAITDDSGIYEKHFYDSLLSIRYVDYQGELCDVGSGAGFPGLVLKIAYPKLKVTLVEPIKKRCDFLLEVIEDLKLQDVEVVNKRAEDYVKERRESYDLVTARAVKNLNILSELCVPLIKVGGRFIILKGSSGFDELKSAKRALELLGTKEEEVIKTNLLSGDTRIIAIYEKIKKTDKKYPRNYSMIDKRPL